MALRGKALIDAAQARSDRGSSGHSTAASPSFEAVRWATGAGAPAFGARPLPERHRPGFVPRWEGKGMTHREGMYAPRFGAALPTLTPDQIQRLYDLMMRALGGAL